MVDHGLLLHVVSGLSLVRAVQVHKVSGLFLIHMVSGLFLVRVVQIHMVSGLFLIHTVSDRFLIHTVSGLVLIHTVFGLFLTHKVSGLIRSHTVSDPGLFHKVTSLQTADPVHADLVRIRWDNLLREVELENHLSPVQVHEFRKYPVRLKFHLGFCCQQGLQPGRVPAMSLKATKLRFITW
jgi:hypothetical protein